MTDISNYPIKYVVQPVYKNKGDQIPYGYIVSKAFVVRELIDYRENGIKHTYNVVFPVTRYMPSQEIVNINYPEFISYNVCRNWAVVYEVFDDHTKAAQARDEANGLLVLQYYPNDSVEKRKNEMQLWEYQVFGTKEIQDLGEVSKTR